MCVTFHDHLLITYNCPSPSRNNFNPLCPEIEIVGVVEPLGVVVATGVVEPPGVVVTTGVVVTSAGVVVATGVVVTSAGVVVATGVVVTSAGVVVVFFPVSLGLV